MTEPTPLDDLPVIDLAAGQRAFSEENLGRLMQLVGPHLNPAHRKLVYILPIASRFAHLAMESHALWNLYGGAFDGTLTVVHASKLARYSEGLMRVVRQYSTLVESDVPAVLDLGHFDAPAIGGGAMTLHLTSSQMLLQAFCEHVGAGNPVRFFDLPGDLEDQARTMLRAYGWRDGEPFVALHVRDGGYLKSARYNNFRTASIENYRPSIDHPVEQGYWVFRLGDASSVPLEHPHDRVIDLPHSAEYDDVLDVYLIKHVHFLLACSSGPEGVARAFVTPILMVNAYAQHLMILNARDLSLFKRYRDVGAGRYLSYREILDSGLSVPLTARSFEEAGIELQENTPDEILAAVEEMLARLAGAYDVDPVIDARFATISQEFAAAHRTRTEAAKAADEKLGFHISAYAYALPGTSYAQSFCRTHPEFLEG
jgi:putative glycosyltransferase (TIGR04372 family)